MRRKNSIRTPKLKPRKKSAGRTTMRMGRSSTSESGEDGSVTPRRTEEYSSSDIEAMTPVTEASLVYLRTKLQAQLIAGHKGSKELRSALAKLEEAQAEREELQEKLRKARTALEEEEARYYAGGAELATSFKSLSDQVKKLVNGPVASVFSELSNHGGEGSSEEEDGAAQEEEVPADKIARFRRLVLKLEAALSLRRPLADMSERISDRLVSVESDVESIQRRLEASNHRSTLVATLARVASDYKDRSETLAQGLDAVLACGEEPLREWLSEGKATGDMKSSLDTVLSIALPSQDLSFKMVCGLLPKPEQIVYDDEGGLQSATGDALFLLLINGEGIRRFEGFERAFMYGFRAWVQPVSLLEGMVSSFCVTLPEEYKDKPEERSFMASINGARHRILRLIRLWITMHEYDFQERKFARLMHSFLDTATTAGYTEEAEKLRERLRGNLFYEDDAQNKYPPPILPKVSLETSFTLLDLDPLEVARQVTLKDSSLYQGMLTRELMDCQWTKKGGRGAPTVKVITERFNKMAAFVVTTIVSEEDLSRRTKTLEMWVNVAEALMGLQNFNGVMQIIASLSKTEVNRLKKTIGGLSKKTVASWKTLRSMLDNNCAQLRDAYARATPPCLPYIGTYLTDLVYIGEMPTKLENGHVSYRKIQLQASSFDALLARRDQVLYRLKEVKEIRDYICRKDLLWTEDAAYAQSLKIEPRK